MMPWQESNDTSIPTSLYSWSESGPDDWRAMLPSHSDLYHMSALSDLSNTALLSPARPPLHNYHLQQPPTTFGPTLSPAPSTPSDCFDASPSRDHISERHLAPTSGGTGFMFSSAHQYDPRCRSPWTNPTASPLPSSYYLDPQPTKRLIDDQRMNPISDHQHGAVFTPASPCDPTSSPLIEFIPSTVPKRPSSCIDEASQGAVKPKEPCLPRPSTSKKSIHKDYGTYQCPYKDCRYGRMFSRKGVLTRHIQTQHLNPGGFKCPLPDCSHASSRRENLKAHRQAVHKEIL